LITYKYGKTHFGREVFFTENEALERISLWMVNLVKT
jgi:hypothetical protein